MKCEFSELNCFFILRDLSTTFNEYHISAVVVNCHEQTKPVPQRKPAPKTAATSLFVIFGGTHSSPRHFLDTECSLNPLVNLYVTLSRRIVHYRIDSGTAV